MKNGKTFTGIEALNNSLSNPKSKTSTVHLKTFEMQKKSKISTKKQTKNVQEAEVKAFLRMAHLAASGSTIDIVNFIGVHE